MQEFSRPFVFRYFCLIKKKHLGGRVTNGNRNLGYLNFKIAKSDLPVGGAS